MQPGIYSDIPNGTYHSGPGVSKSGLDLILRSPMHFKAVRDCAVDREPTAAQQLGTAFHALLLEPAEFTKAYALGLRQQDVPDAIADRDTLVAMVAKLNEGRLPKLSTSGSKDELVARIVDAPEFISSNDGVTLEMLKGETGALLKQRIERINSGRPGLLPDRGTMAELRDILNANGHQVTLWADVKAQWLANNGHRIVLDAETWDQLHRMRDAVMEHPAARALLTGRQGWAELSAYWTDPETGELCRCRPDFWRDDGVVVDVKTTEDASPEGFARSIANWGYHRQHPMYLDGLNLALQQATRTEFDREGQHPTSARAFVFLAVEKKAPHAVGVYVLDQASVDVGRAEVRNALATYAECQRTGVWPGYGDKIQSISLPAWQLNKSAHLLDAA